MAKDAVAALEEAQQIHAALDQEKEDAETEDAKGFIVGAGWNCSGQLGLGDLEPRALPTLIEGLQDQQITAAACGRHHTLVVAAGTIYSFGGNSAGQLGIGGVSKGVDTPGKVPHKVHTRSLVDSMSSAVFYITKFLKI